MEEYLTTDFSTKALFRILLLSFISILPHQYKHTYIRTHTIKQNERGKKKINRPEYF